MAKRSGGAHSELVRAALALDGALTEFERLAAAAERYDVRSERGLQRAAAAAADAQRTQATLVELMQRLSGTLTSAWQRNQGSASRLATRADEIERRMSEVRALLARFGGLGQQAAQITVTVQDLGNRMASAGEDKRAALLAELSTIEEQMGKLVDEGRQLVGAAKSAGLNDLARQTESLRQQVGTARNRLALLAKRLLEQRPATLN
jgi:hypothetical protein